MNRVQISAADAPLPEWSKSLQRFALKALDRLGRDKWDLSVLLCGDKTIGGLNARYRGKAEATDVLSFSLNDGDVFPANKRRTQARYTPGDIVISLDTLRENAGRFKISEDEELRRLLIHGILHLDGMDHRTNKKAEPMLQLQESLLAELAGERIVGRNV
ncbi:MAG: rRNA maturation RNase YbeY [Treponema sp.]|nr:rRNA maturation RNase YbeY [Treponema sp.]